MRASRPMPKLRVFLFQLLCVLGQWERALNQLNVASSLDPAAWPWRRRTAKRSAARPVRAEVFDGKKSPMVFGEPEQWLALLIESLLRAGYAAASERPAVARVRGGAADAGRD